MKDIRIEPEGEPVDPIAVDDTTDMFGRIQLGLERCDWCDAVLAAPWYPKHGRRDGEPYTWRYCSDDHRAKSRDNNPPRAEFVREVKYRSLASRVLVVATTRIEGTWSAYIDAVPGMRHDAEYDEVLRHGCKLQADEARVFFPYEPYGDKTYAP